MKKLFEIAQYYNEKLNKKIYYLKATRKGGKEVNLYIIFSEDNFKHLSGIHKLTDLNYSKLPSFDILNEILNETILYEDIIISDYFKDISNRISNLYIISDILNDSKIMLSKINEQSFNNIKADFLLIKYLSNGEIALLFLVKDENNDTTDDSIVIVPCSFFITKYNNHLRNTERLIVNSITEVSNIPNLKKKIRARELVLLCKRIIQGKVLRNDLLNRYFIYQNDKYYIKNIKIINNTKLVAMLLREKGNITFIDNDFAGKMPLTLHLKKINIDEANKVKVIKN